VVAQIHQELLPVAALVDGCRDQPLAVLVSDLLRVLRCDVGGQPALDLGRRAMLAPALPANLVDEGRQVRPVAVRVLDLVQGLVGVTGMIWKTSPSKSPPPAWPCRGS